MNKTYTEPRGMDLEDAREYIELFAEEFGQAHLYFAQHAAFPLALTPDLLYRLWINFQRNTRNEKVSVPWIAVADLLLCSLCKEVGYELFEMDLTVRAELLNLMKKDENLGMKRIHELSDFLLNYVQLQLSNVSNTRTSKLANGQRWTALAYTQPGKAAHELSEALDALSQNKDEQVRVASLIETLNALAEPEEFEPLLVYARQVEDEVRNDANHEDRWVSSETRVKGQRVESTGDKVERDVREAAESLEQIFLEEREKEEDVEVVVGSEETMYTPAVKMREDEEKREAEETEEDTQKLPTLSAVRGEEILAVERVQTWRELLGILISDPEVRERIANEMNVAPITLTRWATGASTPRLHRLRPIVEALPQYRTLLIYLIQKEFPDFSIEEKTSEPVQETVSSDTSVRLNLIGESTKSVEVFIVYTHEDEELRKGLEKQLRILIRQGIIDVWHDREISAGTEWENEIDKHLNSAQIILLLVSPDFMDSDYCYSTEMKRAMERHERGEARVIPVILRPVFWQGAPFGKFQALPTDAKPIMSHYWHNLDEAFFNVVEGIYRAIQGLMPSFEASSESKQSRMPVSSEPALQALPQQQTRILQILYKERSNPLQVFDREDVAQQMGMPWHDIQPEVAYLVDKGYVATKSRQIGTRIFHMLSITPKGVDFVEKPPLRKIDVFISSPGDVSEERSIVKRVLDRCNRLHSIAVRYVLRPLSYEESAPAEVGQGPQIIVDRHMMKAGDSDLFICMLWQRMGSPVTYEQTGERFQSGTEYEFVDAYRHNQKHGKPYILLYRGLKPFPPEADPEQLRAVQAFFKRFEGEHAEFKGLYKAYRSNEEFEDMLFHDINTAISKNLIL